MFKYDLLIVGSGLYGSTFAYLANKLNQKCLVIDKRKHSVGNVYCKEQDGINIHIYGPHIFHTSNSSVWNFVNQFVSFNRYTNSPIANYKGKLSGVYRSRKRILRRVWLSGVLEPSLGRCE